MNAFTYCRAETLDQAAGLIARDGAKLLAGETDLLVALREGSVQPQTVIDINRLTALRGIRREADRIAIGAAVTFSEIAGSRLLGELAPFLCEAASQVGSPQIRNAGTIGGNIANGSPAADCVVPLVAMDGDVLLVSAGGSRRVALEQVFQARPGETTIGKQEIIVEVSFAVPAAGSRSGFVKLGRRNALSISRLSCAVLLQVDAAGSVVQARVAIGAAGPHPFRARGLEDLLIGQPLTPQRLAAVLDAGAEDIERVLGSRPTMPYKRQAIRGVLWEALERSLVPADKVE